MALNLSATYDAAEPLEGLMHRSKTFSLLLPLVFLLVACSDSNEPRDEDPFDVPWSFGDTDADQGDTGGDDTDGDTRDEDSGDGDTDASDGADSDVPDPDVPEPDVPEPDVTDRDVSEPDAADVDDADAALDVSDVDRDVLDGDTSDAADVADTADGATDVDGGPGDADTSTGDVGDDVEDAEPDTPDAADTTDTNPPDVGPRCGDGTVDDGEECDDGNNTADDGCDPTCIAECDEGYASVGGVCEDVDECTLGLCDAVVSCTNSDGGFACGECPLGYVDVRGDGTLCDSLFETPPAGAPQCYLWGTQHMRSFDGLAYDVQGAGEWRMVVDPDDAEFEVQVRQEPLLDNERASRITRAAIRVGDQRLEVLADASLLIDGVSTTVPAGGLSLDGASVHAVGDTWVVAWSSRAQVRVTAAGGGLDVEVYPTAEQHGRLRGLCADAGGAAVDDVLPPDGEAMLPPVAIESLYVDFVHAWSVTDETAMFTYGAGEGPMTVFDAEHPVEYLEAAELGDADRAVYEPACAEADLGHPFLLEACILDAYWGDAEVAIAAARRVRDPELILALDKPLLFARWEQQGPRPNGVWSVSADFSRVSQSVNGDPTLFVSPNSYINVLIEGTIQVATTDDDDIVGFVFGLRSPISAEGDPVTTFDTYLLDWKQTDQHASGSFAPAGFALSYVNDDFARSGWLRFWSRSDVDGFESLDTDFAPTRGWADNVINEFRLLHTPQRIDIWMNDELIFREFGTFQDGRFGFYNYSQPSVRYANFRAVNVTARTLCGDGVLDVGEACDDENTVGGDGCAADCTLE